MLVVLRDDDGCTVVAGPALGIVQLYHPGVRAAPEDALVHLYEGIRQPAPKTSPAGLAMGTLGAEGGWAMREIDVSLGWHAGIARVPIEGFQSWALTLWKSQLRFDHALWGLGAGVQGDGLAFINSIHLHRLPPQLMVDYEGVRHCDPLAPATTERPGQVVSVSLTDAPWQTAFYEPLRAHGARYGLMHVLCMATVDAASGMHQFVTLARAKAHDRFDADEAARFGQQAPHAMLAYANARAMALAAASPPPLGRSQPWATAIVDRTGTVHDRDAGLPAMLQREWPGWKGARLPPALVELTGSGAQAGRPTATAPKGLAGADRAGRPVDWLGQALKAELTPVNDLYLLALRPRVGDDLLSARERAVAQLYAGGATYREIAERLSLAPATVRAHLRSVFGKLGAHNKAEVAERLRR